MLSREAYASNERDHTYGILGFPCLAGVVSIVPDYTFTVIYTFTIFSKSLFTSGDLNGLCLVASPVPHIGNSYLKPADISRL
jgi:hypothetical protein